MFDDYIGDLYFECSNGERILLGDNVNNKQACKLIHQFLKEHHYKSYYTRMWQKGNEIWHDVGSHTEFFIVVLKEDDMN